MRTFNHLLIVFSLLHLVQVKAQCTATGSHYTASYPAGWNFTHISPAANAPSSACDDNNQGNIWSSGTGVWFFTARGGREMRISRDIPPVSDQTWTMDFTLHITPPTTAGLLENNAPAIILASLTHTQAPIREGCSNGTTLCESCIDVSPPGYPASNVDAMWVTLTSDPPSNCQENEIEGHEYWMIDARARNAGSSITSGGVIIPYGVNATYYIRLQRTGSTTAVLSVYSDPSYSMHVSGSPRCFQISPDITDLNALNHEVSAEGTCNRVFNGVVDHLKIDNNVACGIQPLNPSFSVPAVICQGQPITVDATATVGQPVSSHEWGIQECDAQGNLIGTPVWSFYWGAPDAFYSNPDWITETTTITCGKRYKIFLKVTNCFEEQVAERQIYIACPPPIETSADVTICEGETTILNVYSPGSTDSKKVRWANYPGDGVIVDGALNDYDWLAVAPYVTSHYQVTVTDANGCVNSSIINVDVIANDPSFTTNINNNDPTYATIELIPADLNGLSIPGFDYLLTIEELNASNSSYYTASSSATSCWSSYPANEPFRGFVSTGTGFFTQATSCGMIATPGLFLYDHTYRITRVVMNDYCPPKQQSKVIKPVKSGGFTVYEDKDAPDMTGLLLAQHASAPTDPIHIFPNPSDGVFTIELEEGTGSVLIEVTNALGEKVKTIETTEQRPELDMAEFAKGIYIVAITSNGNTVTRKIVLE